MAEANWQNRTLFVADNIRILRGMNSESVDCIATDPPFNKKRIFNAPLGSRQAEQRFDDRWRWDEVTDEWQDLIASDHPAIKEIIEAAVVIEGGTVDHRTGRINTGRIQNSMAAYLAYMAPRVVEMHRLLKPTGVLFMQCDTEANAYLRLLLDAVFGRRNFINEITRRRASAKGLSTRRLPNNSDTLLTYGKTPKYKWNSSYEPYDVAMLNAASLDDANLDGETRKTLEQYDKRDDDGRRYSLTDLANPNRDRPNLTYEFLGVTRVWRWTRERMEAEYAAGRVVQAKPGNVPRFKRYLDEQPGKPRDDIWDDVVQVEPSELDWDTRKPLDLYRRLVECGTDEGDVVLDPFAGCATSCVAAELLDRQWVGIDIDPVAEEATYIRLREATGLNMLNQPVTVRKTLRRSDVPSVSDQKLRDALWNRQGRLCANPYCDSENLRKVDLHLDHRIPKVRGGEDGVMNRIGLCGNCNSRKGRKAWGLFLDEERAQQPHGTTR